MKSPFYRIVLAVFISTTAMAQIPPMPAQAQPVPAQTLPDFSFTRVDNTVFTQKDLPKEKKLFFIFFDPTCEHCQRAVAGIDRQYLSLKSASIYFISMEDWDKITRFMSIYAPRLKARKNVINLQDRPGLFLARFKPRRYPAMYLYSAGRKLIDYEDNAETVNRLVHAINDK